MAIAISSRGQFEETFKKVKNKKAAALRKEIFQLCDTGLLQGLVDNPPKNLGVNPSLIGLAAEMTLELRKLGRA
jgi:hypothetical protein